jgi:UDP-N-acetylmuramyl pentapeptide phosphotransferase/UDP-N-acetylglucosamine-1-phosphate transferase
VPASRPSSRTGKTKRSRPVSNVRFPTGGGISIVRTAAAALLVLAGIAWLVVYVTVAGPDTDGTKLTWMGDLDRWNYLIGFGLVFLGLAVAAHKSTPLGRGRGVVVGMLGSFLIGLLWIVVYYVTGQDLTLPLFTDLGQYNLMVGIGFMAVGFVYATHWE